MKSDHRLAGSQTLTVVPLLKGIITTNAVRQIASFSYCYDSGGMPVAASQSVEGNPVSGDCSYFYDTSGRLTRAEPHFEDLEYRYEESAGPPVCKRAANQNL